MKKFYLFFISLPILASTLLYLSIWWFIGAAVLLMLFIAYQFYITKLRASESRIEVLENDIDDLNARLETAVLREQKTAREAAKVRGMKQQLLSVLSHEIRTPMNGVMGMSLLLSDTKLTDEQREHVTTIRTCSEGLLTTVNSLLVNDMLDFSRLQEEGAQLEYKSFDLRNIIEEVLDIFPGKLPDGVELFYDIDAGVATQLMGDNRRIRQVLINLVSNAVKFTQRGEITVSVLHVPVKPGQTPELRFEVRDTGCGIAREQLKQLFKGIGPTRNNENEAGLGLVVCNKLVELMGGTIEVQSKEGMGSTFSFTIPLAASPKPLTPHARHEYMHHLEGKRILLAGINTAFAQVLQQQLRDWKLLPAIMQPDDHVSGAKNADVVIIDMDATGGIQSASAMRAQYPLLPVIGLTKSISNTTEAGNNTITAFITKPVKQMPLLDKLLDLFIPAVTQAATPPATELFATRFPLRILVAEDNPVNQKIARKILGKLGYNPDIANHGKEAMEMVGQSAYDLILMDVQMPHMNGLEATRMIRTCLDMQPVIIALTANAMQGDRDECRQAGMDDYMSKPIDVNELMRQLEKWSLVIGDRRRLSA